MLWKKVTRGLSAGRVQSVATRLVVQRERERMAFRSAEYWDLVATFDPGAFDARLVSVDGARVAQGKDFEPTTGELREQGIVHLDETSARALAERLESASFAVRSVDERPYRRKPAAPFRTATLQQEASRKLRFSAQTTMRIAQRLYESGYITYMRTDSTTLSESAHRSRPLARPGHVRRRVRPGETASLRSRGRERSGSARGDPPRRRRVPSAAGVRRASSSRDELALYDLVWKRTLASQMEDARGQTVSLRIGATSTSGEDVEFGASGTVITFRGFLAAYEPGKDEPTDEDEERVLPQLTVGQEVALKALEPDGHATVPPARYTEPTLVRALEERGIGRPSTYAAILSTIVDRGYVFKKGTALVPTFVAFAVVNLLERHFEQLVDFDFTARMEDDLDRIAAGEKAREEWLERFYFGRRNRSRAPPPRHRPSRRDRRARRELDRDPGLGGSRAGRPLRALPRARRATREPAGRPRTRRAVTGAGRRAALTAGQPVARDGPRDGHRDRRSIRPVRAVRHRGARGRRGREAANGLALRVDVARDGHARGRVTPPLPPARRRRARRRRRDAQNGRYGPYIKKAAESRSLETEEQLFTVTIEQAQGTPRRATPTPRETEVPHAARSRSSAPIRRAASRSCCETVVSARTSRTARRTPASAAGTPLKRITLERAVELLAERRAKSE